MRTTRRTLDFAKRLRREMSPPEVRLWVRLRETQPRFPRFRRQHPMAPYVLDFFCPAARLVVEVDGWAHGTGDRPERDARRDAWLEAQGLEVLRLAASEVMAEPDEVADGVARYALERVGGPLRHAPKGARHLPRCAGEEKKAVIPLPPGACMIPVTPRQGEGAWIRSPKRPWGGDERGSGAAFHPRVTRGPGFLARPYERAGSGRWWITGRLLRASTPIGANRAS